MQELPDDCWALVLSRLRSKADRDAAALTCRQWRSLEARFRHSLRFVEPRTVRTEHGPRFHLFLLQSLHSFPNIFSVTIHVGGCDLHNSFSRVFLHKGFAQLTFLDLSLSVDCMNDHLVKCLALNCPSLIHLVFDASTISDAVTDKGIDVLLAKCMDMRQFMVAECQIKGWGFRHGKCLEKIKARDCYFSSLGLAEGLQGPTSLRALQLPITPSEPRLSSIWEYCKGLEVLNLMWAGSLDDLTLENIVESCKNLRVLNVSWCHYVTVDGWEELAFLGRKLEKLAVVGCRQFQPESLLAIAEGCPNLQILKVLDRFAFDASLAQFSVSRPDVEIWFYNRDNWFVPSPVRPMSE